MRAATILVLASVLGHSAAVRAPFADEAIATPPTVAERENHDPCGDEEIGRGVAEVDDTGATPDNVVAPKLVSKLGATYPKEARKAGIEAIVFLRAIIEQDGSVGCLKVVTTRVMPTRDARLGAPLDSVKLQFEQAAKAAVRRWRFKPGRADGQPVRVYFDTVVEFRLRK